MGRNTIARFLLTTALTGLPLTAAAQQAAQPQPQQGGGSDMDFSQPEQPQTPAQPEQPAQGGEQGGSTGGQLQLDVPGGEVAAQHHPFQEDIYAVQQIFALRNRRLELTPTANFSLNDPFVQHTGFGLNANYWISNVLAVGVTGVFFQGLGNAGVERSGVAGQLDASLRSAVGLAALEVQDGPPQGAVGHPLVP